MPWRMVFLGCVLACVTGCGGHAFMGIPEWDSAAAVRVVLDGKATAFYEVTSVREIAFDAFERFRAADRIYAEEVSGAYIYFAVVENRDIRSPGLSGRVQVLERYKAPLPVSLPTP